MAVYICYTNRILKLDAKDAFFAFGKNATSKLASIVYGFSQWFV